MLGRGCEMDVGKSDISALHRCEDAGKLRGGSVRGAYGEMGVAGNRKFRTSCVWDGWDFNWLDKSVDSVYSLSEPSKDLGGGIVGVMGFVSNDSF